ncbi:hypothetical protein IFR09_00930 [Pseudomonas syringae]|nr:hypothetical protein [Pseudomonas syringae]MBD8572885.1 hypothetical protein [Pseudomonas syringae]MBD8790659.1 hypothetical protein [Pseudomonas syringae]MBD8798897.1 hypothetical protein [Pseudomonas syringae]MBD8809724.1 hypothetical protein [Pseudomonas syringae]
MLRKLLIAALAIIALVCAIIVLMVVFLFAQLTPDQTPTYSVPLDMHGPTSTTRLKAWVIEPGLYAVTLRYPFADNVERDKAWALAGGYFLKDDVWSEPGSALVFQVRIHDIPSGMEVLNQQVVHPKLNSWESNYLNAQLLRVKLEMGHYQISVQQEGRLADTPPAALELQFGKAPRPK